MNREERDRARISHTLYGVQLLIRLVIEGVRDERRKLQEEMRGGVAKSLEAQRLDVKIRTLEAWLKREEELNGSDAITGRELQPTADMEP